MREDVTHNRQDADDSARFVRMVEFLSEKRTDAVVAMGTRAERLSFKTYSRLRMAAMMAYVASLFLAYPAYAQFQAVGERLCETGLGEIVAIVFSLFSIYYLFKFIFKVMDAFDKHKSARSGEHEAAIEKMESAGSTFAAALVPMLAAVFFELIGINTFSCIELDIGILGGGGGGGA